MTDNMSLVSLKPEPISYDVKDFYQRCGGWGAWRERHAIKAGRLDHLLTSRGRDPGPVGDHDRGGYLMLYLLCYTESSTPVFLWNGTFEWTPCVGGTTLLRLIRIRLWGVPFWGPTVGRRWCLHTYS